MEGQG
jgi:hypothetical protein